MAPADEQAKLKKRLEAVLKLTDNQVCADCRRRGPRWASANLGVFVCIECSGIHRNLGVHVSFVRSVNLDTWTVKQVDVSTFPKFVCVHFLSLIPTFLFILLFSCCFALLTYRYWHKSIPIVHGRMG